MVQGIDKEAEIISTSAYSNIAEWIPSGNYALNACMSGDLFKAVPSGRIVTLYGDSGTGKSYLACSFCREAQRMGYIPVYLDSEGAIDSAFVKRLGVDPNNLIIKKVNTILEATSFIANLCKELQDEEERCGQHQKVIFVLDSLGNLASEKEIEDTQQGEKKQDYTKAKDAKSMFRVIATPLAKLQAPMIVVNHCYASIGAYVPTKIQASGCLVPTEKICTKNGIKQMSEIVEGDEVLSADGEYHNVSKVWHLENLHSHSHSIMAKLFNVQTFIDS